MPMYHWVDKKTGYSIDILRAHEDYQDEPKDDDLPAEERGKDRDWERKIISAPGVTKPWGWGSKGYW